MTSPFSQHRPSENLRRALANSLRRRLDGDAQLAPLITALDETVSIQPTTGEGALPGELAQLLAGLGGDADLNQAIREFAPTVQWYRILEGAPVEPTLGDGLIVGRPDLPEHTSARLGLFLLRLGIFYPLHQHAALEVYHVVSGKLTLQHYRDGQPFDLLPGDHSVTPCNRLHALRTGSEPCLLAYAWTGDMAAPGWWWEERNDGWWRIKWDRRPDGRWVRLDGERVTKVTLKEAGEA